MNKLKDTVYKLIKTKCKDCNGKVIFIDDGYQKQECHMCSGRGYELELETGCDENICKPLSLQELLLALGKKKVNVSLLENLHIHTQCDEYLQVETVVLSLFDGISCGQQALKELGIEVIKHIYKELK